MKGELKNLLLNKWNIITFCFSLLGFLYDSSQLIHNILSNILPVFIVLFIGIILFIGHYYIKANDIKSSISATKVENKGFTMKYYLKNLLTGSILYKIVFSIIFCLSLLLIISAFSISSKPIYYVVLAKDLTIESAKVRVLKINNLTENGKDFNSRIIKQPFSNNKYLIIISQGFIEKERAEHFKKLADTKLGYNTYISPPSYSTSIFKKILYLNTHYFPSEFNYFIYKLS
jgi:hypothetical protein